MNIVGALLFQILLIALNAVFACAEIAVISMNQTRLEKLAEEGNKKAAKLMKLTVVPARFLATIQVAITLAGFLGSAFAADNFAVYIVDGLRGTALYRVLGASVINSAAVVLTTLILSFFTLVFGELVPKRLAMRAPEKVSLSMAGFLRFVSVLFAPLVWLLTASTNGVLRLLRIDPNAKDEEVTEEGILMMVDAGSESGAIEEDEKEIIQNVFEFNDITAGEIATHRTEMVVLWHKDSPEEWQKIIAESDHTYYPVCGRSVDDITGILNAKIYFRLEDRSRASVLKHAVTPAYFVAESMVADDLLRGMKARGEKVAIVVDEFGGTHGMVTVGDLVERIVGELDPDESEDDIKEIGGNTYRILGSAELQKLEELTDHEFDTDAATVGGWATEEYGSLPGKGATFVFDNLFVTVTAADGKRVREITVRIDPKEEQTDEE